MTGTEPLERTDADVHYLNAQPGCRAQKMVSSLYGRSGLDIFGCWHGRFFFIEKKRVGKQPTARQQSVLRAWAAVGALTGWYTTRAELRDLISGWELAPDPD